VVIAENERAIVLENAMTLTEDAPELLGETLSVGVLDLAHDARRGRTNPDGGLGS
jgi:hypothetical protein